MDADDLQRVETVLSTSLRGDPGEVEFIAIDPPPGVDSLEVALSMRRDLDRLADDEERLRVLQRLLADEQRRRGVVRPPDGAESNG
jgi:hypothetical protein